MVEKEAFLSRWKRRIRETLNWFESKFISQPPADTFAEGQRSLMVKLMSAAGMFCGGFAIALVLIVWKGGWLKNQQELQLWIIGASLILVLVGMLGVIRALSIGGPVGKSSFKVTKDGVEMSSEGDTTPEAVKQAMEGIDHVDHSGS